MENGFKLSLSHFLRVSFHTCNSLNFSDFFQKPACLPRRNRPIRWKVRLFPSMCRPGSSETLPAIVLSQNDDFEFPILDSLQIYSPFINSNMDGRTCPPVSPFSPKSLEFLEFNYQRRKKKGKKKKKTLLGGSEEDNEREEETENFSSDSRRKTKRVRRKGSETRSADKMDRLKLQGKVRDSLAVVKESNDPYNDFRTSMVEMIVEKQMFSGEDLEQLLEGFLSLNSRRHHRIIVQVFSEIWETLLSDCRS